MPSKQVWHDSNNTLHEIYTANIFINNSHFGEFTYDSGRGDLLWHRCSYAFFCPHCGDIWGRIVAADPRGVVQSFEVVIVACEDHHDFWEVPGSLLVRHIEKLLDDLPPKVVKREFEVHLKHLERKIA